MNWLTTYNNAGHTMKITLRNTFHNTEAVVYPKPETNAQWRDPHAHIVRPEATRRALLKLCGNDCYCDCHRDPIRATDSEGRRWSADVAPYNDASDCSGPLAIYITCN